MKAILSFVALLLFFQSCSKEEFEPLKEPQTTVKIPGSFQGTIKYVYFEDWISGVRGGGSGTHFFIEFKEPLSPEISLSQLYFRGKQAKVIAVSDLRYVANFTNRETNSEDTVLSDSDADKMTLFIEPPFPIEDGEALLEYFDNQQINYYRIAKIEERELVFYPQ
nr:hypothetical protein [uncultured Flavobacterium sp.]